MKKIINLVEELDYKKLYRIKYLYHWVSEERVRNYILKNGITKDEDGFVYLSEKPFNKTRKDWSKTKGFLFKVKIPNNDLLYFWEEFWTDENGNEIDSDHQADPKNQYYIYMGDIPLKYVEEVV